MMKKNNPVFIHSLFRTGSTYIWNKFRQHPDFYCYYEPFHQVLADLDYRHPEIWRHDRDCTQTMRHPELTQNYLEEYKKLLRPNRKGVPYFQKSFSFDDFCNTDKDQNPAQEKYVAFLVSQAEEKRALLQFNRSSLRISWFKAYFPGAIHIYLVRHPGDQFHSYLDMQVLHNLDIFLVMDLLLTGVNRQADVFLPLAGQVPLFEYHAPLFDQERLFYSQVLSAYSTAEKYFIFYYIWFSACLENALYADFLLSIDRLSTEPAYRQEFNRFLDSGGVPDTDFTDARVKHYEKPVLGAAEMAAIEETVQSLVFKRYSDEQRTRILSHPGICGLEYLNLDQERVKRLLARDIPVKSNLGEVFPDKYRIILNTCAGTLFKQAGQIKQLQAAQQKLQEKQPGNCGEEKSIEEDRCHE